MSNQDDWNFKVNPKKIPKQETKSYVFEKKHSQELELDLESAVKSQSLRVHAGKSFDVKVAKAKDRFIALAIDLTVIVAVALIIKFLFYQRYLMSYLGLVNPYVESVFISYFLCYFLILKITGHSLGKKLMKMKIEDIDGGPLSFFRLFLREMVLKPIALVTIIPLLIFIFTKKHFALHDYLCKSLVSIWEISSQS